MAFNSLTTGQKAFVAHQWVGLCFIPASRADIEKAFAQALVLIPEDRKREVLEQAGEFWEAGDDPTKSLGQFRAHRLRGHRVAGATVPHVERVEDVRGHGRGRRGHGAEAGRVVGRVGQPTNFGRR